MDLFSFKELYDVYFKATYSMELGNRKIEPGEILMSFDRVQIASLQEDKTHVAARGGWDNRGRVFWDTTHDIRFLFSAGVFSKTQWALLSNSKVVDIGEKEEPIYATLQEEKETDENGQIELTHVPVRSLFLYNKETGEKLPFTQEAEVLTTELPFTNVVAAYEWELQDGARVVKIGDRLLKGFFSLEAKTRIQDDKTGEFETVLIRIPKMKLMSDLSIKLGDSASPVVANFATIGIPVGSRGNSCVAETIFLNGNI